jgi:hypothetical protein
MPIYTSTNQTSTLQVAESSCLHAHSGPSDHPHLAGAPSYSLSDASGRTQRPATFLITRSLQEPGTGTEIQPPAALDELAGPARTRGAVSSQEASAPHQSAAKKRAKCRYFATKKGT